MALAVVVAVAFAAALVLTLALVTALVPVAVPPPRALWTPAKAGRATAGPTKRS